MNYKTLSAATLLIALSYGSAAQAGFLTDPIAAFDGGGWTQFQDDSPREDGENGPGVGGQDFDAEYLFYKWDGSTLNIVLQTGFDLVDGEITYDGKKYWTGDLALSFDGDADSDGAVDSTTWEYGIDFGLLTKSYGSSPIDFTSGTGIDPAGLYEVAAWDNSVYSGHHVSDPYAITDIVGAGAVTGLTTNTAGYDAGLDTFYRHVAFDTAALGISITAIDVHWTMSCGNDNINGRIDSIPVPEPESIALILMGLLGIAGASVRRRKLASEGLFSA